MAEPLVFFEKKERVGLITLNRPQALNALSRELMKELGKILSQCEADPTIHCMVLTGSERAFAAGADIKEMQSHTYEGTDPENFITRGWEQISACRKPIIAAVSGYALGGGCEIAMMCDIIIAEESARFAQPEVTIGTMPGAGGTQRMLRAIGKAKTMEMCLTGCMMGAHEAERAGLVSRVVSDGKVVKEALEVAYKISTYSLPVLIKIKESINQAFELPLSEGLRLERKLFHATFALEDQKEGMTAFIEKRAPLFKDR